jgi:hypothetical protein
LAVQCMPFFCCTVASCSPHILVYRGGINEDTLKELDLKGAMLCNLQLRSLSHPETQ